MTPELVKRQERYAQIMELRNRTPPATFEEIGAQLDPPVGKERVRQIIAKGMPKRPGRPAGPKRRAKLERRLGYWEDQLAVRHEQGLDTRYAASRVERIATDLAALEGELAAR